MYLFSSILQRVHMIAHTSFHQKFFFNLSFVTENQNPFVSYSNMQNFDEIQECPHCHTNKELKSDLQFLFSECCGYALCVSCTSQIFSKNTVLRCPNCNETVNKKKYSKNRLATQQFNNESHKRSTIHISCNLRRGDFKTLKEWNDYLELVEDIVYDLSHGNAQERKQAEEKLKDFKIKYADLIERNRNLETEENLMKSYKEEHGIKDEDDDSKMKGVNNNNPGNTASVHPVFTTRPPAVCIDRQDTPVIPSKLLKDTEKLQKRRQKAAGFMTMTASLREKSEVLSGLFHFPETRNTNDGNHINGK